MSTPGHADHEEYRDARGAVGHQPHQDSARRIVVIFGIIILAIGLMLVVWRLALLQT